MSFPWTSFLNQRDVRETPVAKLSSGGASPVGSVTAWLKDYTNTPALPDGWVECNGQTLSDGASVYNGQVIPNLNGGDYFIRGNATSGVTGGSTSSSHTHGTGWGMNEYGDIAISLIAPTGSNLSSPKWTSPSIIVDNSGPSSITKMMTESSSSSTIPPYYAVVFIMRVR